MIIIVIPIYLYLIYRWINKKLIEQGEQPISFWYFLYMIFAIIFVISLFLNKAQSKEFDLKTYKETMKYYEKLEASTPYGYQVDKTYFGYFNKKEQYEKKFPNVKITKVIRDFNVEKCIDGDTIKGFYFDEEENFNEMTIRILLIDTFETKKNKQAQEQLQILKDIADWNKKYITINNVLEKGQEAKKICEEHFINVETGITLFCWKKDKYKRDLCFIINESPTNDLYYIDYLIFNGLALPYKPY